jgi:hypothetical protein
MNFRHILRAVGLQVDDKPTISGQTESTMEYARQSRVFLDSACRGHRKDFGELGCGDIDPDTHFLDYLKLGKGRPQG